MKTLLDKLNSAQIKRRLEHLKSLYLSLDDHDLDKRVDILDDFVFYKQILKEKEMNGKR